MSILNSFQNIQKSAYRGLKFYNLRSEIGIASVENNSVVLYSTLDSINHGTLQYSILPDLRRYSAEKNIDFQHLTNDERHNRFLKLGQVGILILENKIDSLPKENIDYILWRKNNYNNPVLLLDTYENAKIIVDGSNSDKTIKRLKNAVGSNSSRFYILKNNFAYVWEGE